jgi:hypothetical protein
MLSNVFKVPQNTKETALLFCTCVGLLLVLAEAVEAAAVVVVAVVLVVVFT